MRLVLSNKHILYFKVVIHFASLAPLLLMFYWGITNELKGDPVERLLHFTGISACNLLLLSLLISPLAKKLKAAALMKLRRLTGLYSFTYAVTHFITYIVFELQLNWSLLSSEIVKRPYITIGLSAFIILLLLASTSTRWAQRKLARNWQKLHNWVYLSLILAITHYLWSVKVILGQPLIYLFLAVAVLLLRRKKLLNFLPK